MFSTNNYERHGNIVQVLLTFTVKLITLELFEPGSPARPFQNPEDKHQMEIFIVTFSSQQTVCKI